MRQVCEELSDVINVVVKRLNLPGDKIVHVIKFEEKPYVVRSEISALLWESDILRSMVSQNRDGLDLIRCWEGAERCSLRERTVWMWLMPPQANLYS